MRTRNTLIGVAALLLGAACVAKRAPAPFEPVGPRASGGSEGHEGAGSGGSGGSAGGGGAPVASDAARPDAPAERASDRGSGVGSDVASAGPVPLPLVVTEHFPNRGWFGDAAITSFFKPGVQLIVEAAASDGPCAARPAGARGRCLRITYTPPPGLPPAGAGTQSFLGSYMLGALTQPHPAGNPPGKPGDPNWGQEPGLAVMPGARQVSFYAASPEPDVKVAFRAGTAKDAVLLPERTELLNRTWTRYTMPLAGGAIGEALLGGFAWTLKDTRRGVTFYLDDVVWEADGALPPTPPRGQRDGVRQLVFINRCAETVHVGGNSQMGVPEGGGFVLAAGQTRTVTLPGGAWSGRFWGRTGCSFDGGGKGRCATGDCDGRLQCAGGGKTPATLAELTVAANGQGPDFYDISLVDGYNLPMAMGPVAGTHDRSPGAPYDCGIPSCIADLNATCPMDLRVGSGQTIGCLSACERYQTDALCCRGAHGTADTCPPFAEARIFKAACPTAYSYAYDDATSTFTCKGEDYAIWFCPEGGQP